MKIKALALALFFCFSWAAAGAQYYGQFRYKPAGGGGGTPVEVCITLSDPDDDAEENIDDGSISASSSDLELGFDSSDRQWIGMRFSGMNIPAGATVTNAQVQFGVDNTSLQDPCSVDFYAVEGNAAGDLANFAAEDDFDITSRDRTETKVTWTLTGDSWSPVGNAGPDQLSVNFATVIQEVVNHPNYTQGDPIIVLIEGIEGEREAESVDGNTPFPELCVTYLN